MFSMSRMSKEKVITTLGRFLIKKNVVFSKWQVDAESWIPIRPVLAPIREERSTESDRAGLGIRRILRLRTMTFLVMALTAAFAAQASQSVSVAWNPSTDPNSAGYIVYAGSSPSSLTHQMNVGTNTMVTFSGLREGSTNFFAVASYNAANIVGSPSPVINYLVPGLMTISFGKGNPAPVLSFPVASGHSYVVQASTNLTTWQLIYTSATATNNVWTTFHDTNSSSFPHRFYRLVLH